MLVLFSASATIVAASVFGCHDATELQQIDYYTIPISTVFSLGFYVVGWVIVRYVAPRHIVLSIVILAYVSTVLALFLSAAIDTLHPNNLPA